MDQGQELLQKGRQPEAEARFREAAALSPLPAARNNWALCRHEAGDPAGALTVLEPLLADPAPLPFSRGLASLALADLGRRTEARQVLDLAIRDFDRGLANPALRGQVSRDAWVEYTVTIKHAAGTLGEHRLVLDLHNRWPGRDMASGAFAAGAAAFNLGRFAQAVRYWRGITAPGWVRLMGAYAHVAQSVQDGLVPPFPIEYRPDDDLSNARPASDAEWRDLLGHGTVRMRWLAMLFDATDMSDPDRGRYVTGLITFGGDWGVALGRRLLDGPVPLSLKMAAASALVERGVFAPGEKIPAVHEGRPTHIVLRQVAVRGDDPALSRRYQEAIRLRDTGDKDAAYRLLMEMQLADDLYPPAMIALANLMRGRGELDEAQQILESLEAVCPDEPAVYFNLAGLWLQRGNREQARRWFERINPAGVPDEFRRRLAELERILREPESALPGWDIDALGDGWRQELEARPIPTGLTLRRALKEIPVEWLNAAARTHGIPSTRRRQERAQKLEAELGSPERLAKAVASLGVEARSALRFTLERGGWCKLQLLTSRFGSLDGDGFWWDERPPASPVGQLRALALLFVGRARVDERWHKVAVVPAELRAPLSRLLSVEPALP